jgi:hypothetical protein
MSFKIENQTSATPVVGLPVLSPLYLKRIITPAVQRSGGWVGGEASSPLQLASSVLVHCPFFIPIFDKGKEMVGLKSVDCIFTSLYSDYKLAELSA